MIKIVCLGVEPRAAGWKARMDQLSYGNIPLLRAIIVDSCTYLNFNDIFNDHFPTPVLLENHFYADLNRVTYKKFYFLIMKSIKTFRCGHSDFLVQYLHTLQGPML